MLRYNYNTNIVPCGKAIYTAITPSVIFSGNGTACDPLAANVRISSQDGNIIGILEDGLYTNGMGGNPNASITGTSWVGNVYKIFDSSGGTFSNVIDNFSGLTVNGSVRNGNSVIASGEYSHAEGLGSSATGSYSHAEGSGTLASGSYSHAEGAETVASGTYSHAEGLGTQAIGQRSHAEGVSTIANGWAAHAEGAGSSANGFYSHAEGGSTRANGTLSHAEGDSTIANGECSHTEGSGTTANGIGSHAEGLGTIAQGDYQHVSGTYNLTAGTDTLFIIGNGTDESNRSNLALFHTTGITFNQAVTAPTYYGDGSNLTGISAGGSGIIVTAQTANYTVTAGDDGKYFTNEDATDTVNFTLPSAAKNLHYTFIIQNSNQMDITCAGGNTIRMGSNESSDGGTISGFDIGSTITLVAINSFEWIATSTVGTWLI